jgi:predicted MFS family arabinose efflux permease
MQNNKSGQVVAAIVLSCAGVFMVFGMPSFVFGLISILEFSQSQANLISSAEIAGMALSSLLSILWIGRFNWRKVALCALLAIVLGNLISTYITDFQLLVSIRFLTGLVGHGTAFALGIAAIGSTSEPDKNFGFTIASQVVMGALTLFFAPKLIAAYGIAGMCFPAAILACIAMTLTSRLAQSGGVQAHGSDANQTTGLSFIGKYGLPIAGLLVMIAWQMGVGPFFNNLFPFGISINLDPSEIGTALFLSTGLSIIGPLSASALASKVKRVIPVCLALAVQLLVVLSFQGEMTWAGFAIRAILFQTAWNFTGPFLMGMIATMDNTGRFSALIPASQLGGIAIGQAIIASLVQGNNLALINYFCAIVIFLSALIFIFISGKINRN